MAAVTGQCGLVTTTLVRYRSIVELEETIPSYSVLYPTPQMRNLISGQAYFDVVDTNFKYRLIPKDTQKKQRARDEA